ncbi:MAG TPA: ribonuclease III [Candidatus Faecenecus gallistercoris]|uniref:Ribonuclease 3 n=1 Tax=Candidatus Faecenecus gallistercoris TaxID=2840793 RepID=A0A9D1CJY2_9FIRM|nr:ribonuclease III [Bacillota bacterium]MDD7102247.1 ribonuclease III [Bacillota bacterium]MDY4051496.1 ribonuclease III [Candidatus Faecenecus gallistercoris]PWL72532.1 MAG: ribonuclease III [Bacillota bacterium]HIQ64265.1 ribonuclease III [Candidatus Faecenecus gallistercoris]
MEELLERLKIKPKNKKLYETAFQHSSYVYENHLKADYERLEFLGDAVLDLVLADYLYNNAHESEGDMTKVRASYVCENANYQYAIDLHLSDYIKVGHGEEESGGRFKKVIMADIFEALMGAIYIDQGYAKARQVILHIVVPYIKNPDVTFFEDYKSALQEAVQTDQKSVSYELVKEEGPAHNRTFTTEVKVDDVSYGVGVAGSKKESEQEAARIALSKLAK